MASTGFPKWALILFDSDGCTMPVKTALLQCSEPISTGAVATTELARDKYSVEIIFLADAKLELNEFEKEWSMTERSNVIDAAKSNDQVNRYICIKPDHEECNSFEESFLNCMDGVDLGTISTPQLSTKPGAVMDEIRLLAERQDITNTNVATIIAMLGQLMATMDVRFQKKNSTHNLKRVNKKRKIRHETPPISTELPCPTVEATSIHQLTISSDLPAYPVLPTISSERPTITPELSTISPERPTISPERPTISPECPAILHEPPAISHELSAISLELSAISIELPAISHELSAISLELSAISLELSAISIELPAIPHELPVISHALPVISRELPAISHELPAISLELLAISLELPAISTELPAISAELPGISPELPAISTELPVISPEFPFISTEFRSVSIDFPSFTIQLSPVVIDPVTPNQKRHCVSPNVDGLMNIGPTRSPIWVERLKFLKAKQLPNAKRFILAMMDITFSLNEMQTSNYEGGDVKCNGVTVHKNRLCEHKLSAIYRQAALVYAQNDEDLRIRADIRNGINAKCRAKRTLVK